MGLVSSEGTRACPLGHERPGLRTRKKASTKMLDLLQPPFWTAPSELWEGNVCHWSHPARGAGGSSPNAFLSSSVSCRMMPALLVGSLDTTVLFLHSWHVGSRRSGTITGHVSPLLQNQPHRWMTVSRHIRPSVVPSLLTVLSATDRKGAQTFLFSHLRPLVDTSAPEDLCMESWRYTARPP